MEKNILDSYYNDGYIYCFMSGLKCKNGNNLVKIGKTSLKKSYTEQQTLNGLINRYSTYYPDFEIIHFIRVGNCHLAELRVFELLNDLHYNKEHYIFNDKIINQVFEQILLEYPNIQELIKKVDINVLNNINRFIKAN